MTSRAVYWVRPSCVAAGLVFLLSSCAGDNAPTTGATPWCRPLSFAATVGAPGERVAVAGLPEGQATVYARITVPGSDTEAQAVILAAESGDDLIVPLHPLTPLQGGRVSLALTDGAQTCLPVAFEILPMADPNSPEVQGTLERQATELQNAITTQAQAAGIDPARLKGELAALPPEAAPLGLAQFFVDHPDNPNALAEIARRGSVLYDGELVAFDRELMDALAYHFRFTEASSLFVGGSLRPLAEGTSCVGPAALASAEVLDGCLAYHKRQQAIADALSGDADTVLTYLAPLVIVFPPLAAPLLTIGMAHWAVNASYLVAAGTSPGTLASLSFTASPTAFQSANQTGSWSGVLVTVADNPGVSVSKIVADLATAFGPARFFARLGPQGGRLRALVEVVFEAVVKGVLNSLQKAYGKKLDTPPVPYSSYPPVDIAAYRQGYRASITGGNEVVITNPDGGVYAPAVPFSQGAVDLVLSVVPGHFGDAAVQGAMRLTVGNPTEADATFEITNVETQPIAWNASGLFKVFWAGENVRFPVTMEVRVTDCGGFDRCDLPGETYKNRANPLLYGVGCTTENIDPGLRMVRLALQLTDSAGKTTTEAEASIQCGQERDANRLGERLRGGSVGAVR